MRILRRLFVLTLVLGLAAVPPARPQSGPFGEDSTVGAARTTAAGTGAEAGQVAINSAWVNVRSGPGVGNAILKTLPRGTSGQILDQKNGWYLIDFGNGLKGWVRGDLVSGTAGAPPAAVSSAVLDREFARWDRHLGTSLLDFSRFNSWWGLGRAWKAFQNGDWQGAYELAQNVSTNPVERRYLMAKCLAKLGQTGEARQLLDSIRKYLEDYAMVRILDGAARPYIEEGVPFKFGGFDDLATYRAKVKAGNRLGLESSEYYEDFVDINTWKWKSPAKAREFEKIGGLDCSGYVQRVQKDLFAAAGVKYPISGRTSTRGLWSGEFTTSINPGVKPPPPPDIRPGDMILLDYGHNRYGHSMIYRGMDAKGNILVTQMGGVAELAVLPPEKYQFYKGTYRMKGMDKVREKLLA